MDYRFILVKLEHGWWFGREARLFSNSSWTVVGASCVQVATSTSDFAVAMALASEAGATARQVRVGPQPNVVETVVNHQDEWW